MVLPALKSIYESLSGLKETVPDVITLDMNYAASLGIGGSYTFTLNYITRGPDIGFYRTTTLLNLYGGEWAYGVNLGYLYYFGAGDMKPGDLLGSSRSFSIGNGTVGANVNYGYRNFSDYTYKPILGGNSGGLGIQLGATWGQGETWSGWSFTKKD